ncbi:MAG: glycosyltransferase family 2 protein, partial [Desulfobacula sp.]|nr:glycosyltransferase family 2 protein [Desulfobacula sp.]
FKESSGKYIALINNDVVLDKFWLECMVKMIKTSNQVGFCSSKIIITNTEKIDSIGDQFTTAFTGTKVGEYQSCKKFFKSIKMDGVCAAAALYKRKMIEDIGFFQNIFFLNHEDTDLNMRAWLSGWKCYYAPDAIAYHDVNRSIGTLSYTSVYYFSRNNIWVWLINIPAFFIIRNFPQRILYEISAAFYFCVMHKQWKPYLKGKADAFKYCWKIIPKRRAVQKKIRLSNEQISCELKPIIKYLFERLSGK